MDTFEAITSRRAVKHYDPAHRFTPEEEKTLLGAALLSPTAFNIQQWRFVVVRDMELRKRIRAVAWDQAQVTDASHPFRMQSPPTFSPPSMTTVESPSEAAVRAAA